MIRPFPRNIRLRITTYFTLVFGFVTGVPAFLTYQHLEEDLDHHVDRDLREKMRYVLWVIDRVRPQEASREFLSGVFSGKTTVGDYLHYVQAVRARDDSLVINSHGDIRNFTVEAARSGRNPCDITIGNSEFRVFRTRHREYDVYVATSIELVNRGLREIRVTYVYAFPLALIVASLMIFIIVTRAFSPITTAARQAERITARNLQERLPPARNPDEVGELVATLNRMIQRIEDGFNTITRFTADAAHELQTPLTILRGEIEVALRNARPGDEMNRLLESNLDEVNRLIKIVDDLFTLSRIDNMRLPVEFARVEIAALLEELYEKSLVIAQPKAISLRLEIHDRPAVIGDAYRLIQLFLNLINNAVRYTPERGAILLSCRQEGPEACVQVADTGIGIAQADQERIFDRFYRVDKARSREEGGTGLGLAIAKWITEIHNGSISVRSDTGKGSTFEVRLPIAPGGPGGAGAKEDSGDRPAIE